MACDNLLIELCLIIKNCILSKQPTDKMNENTNLRKRTHRIKTMNSQATHPSLLLSLQNKLNSTMFRQEIGKINSLMQRNTRENKHFSNNRRSSLIRRATLSQKVDFTQKSLSYYLMDHCNNEDLISRLLEQRGRWTRSETRSGQIHLIWGYLNNSQASRLKGKEVLSRVPRSSEMTDKGKLYENISKYCDKKCLSLNFLPITFHFDREGPIHLLRENIREFLEFFMYVKENTTLTNTWIMKPTNMNQGRDIHLFNSIEALLKLAGIKCNQNNLEELQKSMEEYIRSNRSLILQKYIENPLLLEGHKFDIRMWVLVDHLGNYYIFEEGYLRFTSAPYRLDAASITNNFVHLTNHSLQKHSPNYSKLHSLRSMEVLKTFLINQNQRESYEKITKDMKRIVDITIMSALGSRSSGKQKHLNFEIFGFDFLVDRQLNVRLIEANCNPAITEDCPLLAQLIPKMINDAFKLTIDKIYNTKNSKSYHIARLSLDNSWEKLGEI